MGDSKIIIYNTPDGETTVSVNLDGGTVWLSQQQMAELFGKDTGPDADDTVGNPHHLVMTLVAGENAVLDDKVPGGQVETGAEPSGATGCTAHDRTALSPGAGR